jgi:methylmalonyl-CoA/ethylmalonyl-CoA epimerase
MMTKWPFSKIHHIHVIVKDIHAVESFLGSIGVTLDDYVHPGSFTQLQGAYDEKGLSALHYKYVKIGDVHFQFMSPKDDRPSPHNSFLEKRGNGVYSVGFLVDDVDAAEAEGIRQGLKILMRGRHEDGWGYTYFDTAATLGINLTIRQNPYAER